MSNIYFILVNPQLPENIGSAARSMMNFGHTKLRIVAPRCGWPNERAYELAVGGKPILDNLECFQTLDEAIEDIEFVFATSKRQRYMNKTIISSSQMNENINQFSPTNKIAILFGPERSGLENNDISKANTIIEIATNPEYGSINLAQSVTLIAYELSKFEFTFENEFGQLASTKEVENMFVQLEKQLTSKNFYQVPEKKAGMNRNIRNIFKRIDRLTSQDVRTLMGIFSILQK